MLTEVRTCDGCGTIESFVEDVREGVVVCTQCGEIFVLAKMKRV